MVLEGEEEVQEAVDYLKEAGYKCTNGFIKNRKSLRNALDIGKTLIEVPFKSVTKPIEMIIQSIADELTKK